MPRYALPSLVALAAALASAAAVQAQAPGPFTAVQADRGAMTYSQNCALCHGDDMGGGAGVPALSGPEFGFGWKGKPVSDLFDKISTQMPPGAGGSLTDQQYLDVVSAILRKNGAAAGPVELKPGSPGLKAVGLP